MILKHALITCLLLFILHHSTSSEKAIPPNPVCTSPGASPDDRPAHFLFFVDKLLEPELVSRIQYMFKAIFCEIPAVQMIKNTVLVYALDSAVPSLSKTSDQIIPDLYREVTGIDSAPSTPCQRFARALGRSPETYKDKDNVQFMVPIFEDTTNPGCFLKAFQNEFKSHDNRNEFFFNGFLINNNLTDANRQGVKILIPSLEKAVNTSRESLAGSSLPNAVHEASHLVQSYGKLMRDILLGNTVRDWEEILTTTLFPMTSSTLTSSTPTSSTPTSSSPTSTKDSGLIIIPVDSDNTTMTSEVTTMSTSEASSTTTTMLQNLTTTSEEEESEADKFFGGFNDDDYDYTDETNSTVVPESNTTIFVDKRAAALPEVVPMTTNYKTLNHTATNYTTNYTSMVEVEESSTVEIESTVPTTTELVDRDYDLPPETKDQLDMASGSRDRGHYEIQGNQTVYVAPAEPAQAGQRYTALTHEVLFYIFLLLILIWLFCLFLCLAWMFRCAKNKKHKIEDETEQQRQLLLPLLESRPSEKVEPSAPKMTTTSTDSDDVDDEWKNIKPAQYTSSTVSQNPTKSELETVKPPSSAAQYAPVEVSEFEDKIDDDVNNRPRGYVQTKRTAPLRFD